MFQSGFLGTNASFIIDLTLLEPAEPEQTVIGLVSFFDSAAPSDSVVVLLSGIAAPANGAT